MYAHMSRNKTKSPTPEKDKLNKRQEDLLAHFVFLQEFQMSEILRFSKMSKNPASLATLKRDMNFLCSTNHITKTGKGRNVNYVLSDYGLLHRNFDPGEYEKQQEDRSVLAKYNFRIFDILKKEEIFTGKELEKLENATREFAKKAEGRSETIHKKELERFVIELSWKSSKIEGNTYTLLDTEKLLREGIESPMHTKDEARMIVNHKNAFAYIIECKKVGKDILTFRELENVHRILTDGLGVNRGLRASAVGITGTRYLPLAIQSQIEEETGKMITVAQEKRDTFSKTLIAILGISYLQPFEDGNKRTSRIFSNAILLQNNCAPLSYRGADEKEYREAMLIFYEQNSLEPFKKIFIDQYIFACENYNVGEAG